MKSFKHFKKKIQASLVVPFLALLFITSLVTVEFYQIRVANAHQYRLLQDTYRLKIMLELSVQNLDSHLQAEGEEIIFPSRFDFSTGSVVVDWNEKEKSFQLEARLKNGSKRREMLYLHFNEEKVVSKITE